MSLPDFNLTPQQLQQLAQDRNTHALLPVSAFFVAFNTVIVGLRFYSRISATGVGLGVDDWLIVPAWVFAMGMCALGIISEKDGAVGYHIQVVLALFPNKLVNLDKMIFALQYIYLTAVAFPKLSILALYLRIFTRGIRIACYVVGAIVIANWLAWVVASTAECIPISNNWNLETGTEGCFNVQLFWELSSLPSILIDIPIILLPLRPLLKLQTSTPSKIGVILTFLTGGVGIVSSCIRMSVFYRTDALLDVTWTPSELIVWSVIEPSMYLIAACLPTLRPLVERATPRVVRSFFSSRIRSTFPSRHTYHRQGDTSGQKPGFLVGGSSMDSSRGAAMEKGEDGMEATQPLSGSRAAKRESLDESDEWVGVAV